MGRSAQQGPETASAGIAVERAARIIRDLPDYIPRKSAQRIVTNTLRATGVEVEELPRSTGTERTKLQDSIGRSLKARADLEQGTAETIRSLEEQINKARDERDTKIRQEQEHIEQARSALCELKEIREFLVTPTQESLSEVSVMVDYDTVERDPSKPLPTHSTEIADKAAGEADGQTEEHYREVPEAPDGSLPKADGRSLPPRYGLAFPAILLSVVLGVGTLSYSIHFIYGQAEQSIGSVPSIGANSEEPEDSPASKESKDPQDPQEPKDSPSKRGPGNGKRPTARPTDNVLSSIVSRNRSPSLATPAADTPLNYDGQIALTFDDGPDPRTTPSILGILRRNDLKATFFVSGAQADQNPGLIKRIVKEGHTLGNHTYDHKDMSLLSPWQMRSELQSTQRAVDRALGYHYKMRLIRPPYGEPYYANPSMLPLFRKAMQRLGLIPVLWTIDSRDWALEGQPTAIVRKVSREMGAAGTSGGVILFHDTSQSTVQALPRIISQCRSKGFVFKNAPELLGKKYGSEDNLGSKNAHDGNGDAR